MLPFACLMALTTLGQATAADSVTLGDGKVVLGQLVDSERRGPQLMIVRRAWAEKNLPEKIAAWDKADSPTSQRAETQRRERLTAWRRDRLANPNPNDRIKAWLDAELARKPGAVKAPLMLVRLSRTDVKQVEKRPKASGRMLRLGWLSGFDDVETMPLDSLTQSLEARGFAPGADSPVSVDSLLPPQAETDAHWLARRAATELANDEGGRFLRFGSTLMPEPAPGEIPPPSVGMNIAVSALKDFLGDGAQDDPLLAKLRQMEARGKVGALVTRLELAPDFSAVGINATVWVRVGRDKWTPALVRTATANPEGAGANAAAALGNDPQVKAAFGAIENLGYGSIPPEFKERGLRMGAATAVALGQARVGLSTALDPLVISLEPPKEKPPAEKPR